MSDNDDNVSGSGDENDDDKIVNDTVPSNPNKTALTDLNAVTEDEKNNKDHPSGVFLRNADDITKIGNIIIYVCRARRYIKDICNAS